MYNHWWPGGQTGNPGARLDAGKTPRHFDLPVIKQWRTLMIQTKVLGFVVACWAVIACTLFAQTSAPVQIESWVTNQDRSSLFQKQPNPVAFQSRAGGRGGQPIVIDETKQM
jgi:hypothetical protein